MQLHEQTKHKHECTNVESETINLNAPTQNEKTSKPECFNVEPKKINVHATMCSKQTRTWMHLWGHKTHKPEYNDLQRKT